MLIGGDLLDVGDDVLVHHGDKRDPVPNRGPLASLRCLPFPDHPPIRCTRALRTYNRSQAPGTSSSETILYKKTAASYIRIRAKRLIKVDLRVLL